MEASVSFHHRQNFTPPSRDKRAMPFQEITRGLSHFGLRASLRRRLGRHNTLTPSRPLILTKTLAVSDGELNALEPVKRAGTQCSNSNSSLPSVPSGGASGVGQVASWAVSFERLLEDPLGVHYFTEFLKSEVSVENILFWLDCENFRKIPADNTEKLSREALSIYNRYLSKCACSPINIDDKVRVDEKDIQQPHPEIFQKAQQQIFKLMKFDSYTRFVRSQLYQNCMLANVEGRFLPEPGQCPKLPLSARHSSPATREQHKSELKLKEKAKVKLGKSAGGETDDVVERRKITLQGRMSWEKRKEKRGSWGESQITGRPGTFQSAEVERLVARSADSASELKTTADKYCCVFLPDGTASLTPARSGISVRRMLTGLCEKRGLPLSDIIIYLQGKDKQPLSLDQDSSVLKDQQVLLELRVTFALEVAFTGKTVAMVAKSNKTLQEALTSLLQKHRLRPQDVFVTMKESQEPINMNTIVTSLANMTLILDKVKDMDQGFGSKTTPVPGLQARRGAVDVDVSAASFYRSNPKQKNPAMRRAYDMEGLVELLNRAQGCSADDQRGLLKKEDLILPNFLQLPLEEHDEEEEQQEEQRRAAPLAFRSTETLGKPTSNTKGDVENSSTSSLCSTEPVDRKLTKEHSNPARETVV
ncbi:regulator of G-protein signaling 14 isoform X1 [Pangasianodon hypophthalmus]|uniref:regulator of G-protein signaling 14 isoform X1 n=1 Tax=Pangasianodon hypophthalmus TaxID=310915 RepID=UPI002307EFF4|nr:regulator of G-protein signaling 14 isoform X1 [Pangasianodon hypophthalmus]